jgi:pimeloyl-ACP methyl ester carboxylesterase
MNWRRNIPALRKDARVYALDLLNMGESQRVNGLNPSLEATADRVAACMDALGLAEADIVAHSHGGGVATMLAARHPKRVRSLILFAPVNPFSDLGDLLVRFYSTSLGRLLALTMPYLPRRVQVFGLGRMYGDPSRIVDGSLEGYMEGMRVPGTLPHILAIVRGWFRDIAALKTALPRVTAPTLLIWGDKDRAVDPASAVELQRRLRQCELQVVRGGGHIVFEELPEEANRLMLDWLLRDLASNSLSDPAEVEVATQRSEQPRPVSAARPAGSTGIPHLSTGT